MNWCANTWLSTRLKKMEDVRPPTLSTYLLNSPGLRRFHNLNSNTYFCGIQIKAHSICCSIHKPNAFTSCYDLQNDWVGNRFISGLLIQNVTQTNCWRWRKVNNYCLPFFAGRDHVSWSRWMIFRPSFATPEQVTNYGLQLYSIKAKASAPATHNLRI